jgi:hypothetical protein
MLREMLLRDFGKDLKISGGTGNSIEDPITLDPQSPHDASWTEMEVARCIYGRLGWHWRAIDRSRAGKIEKLSCEVRYAEGDEVVTEKRAFYFDVSSIGLNDQDVTPACGFNLGAGTGMGLPYQLGWFHFDQLTNNEETQAGMGVSAAYSAPSTKATVIIYNKGLASIESGNDDLLSSEFDSAVADILAVYPDAKKIAARHDSNLLFAAFDIGTAYSMVTLSAVGNHFFKVRATIDPSSEKYTFDCLWVSVNTILSMTKPRELH